MIKLEKSNTKKSGEYFAVFSIYLDNAMATTELK